MSKAFVYNLLLDHLLSFIIVVTKITDRESPSHTPKVTISFDGPEEGGGGGGGALNKVLYGAGSIPRSKTLPFYIQVLIDKEPLSCTFHGKLDPFHMEQLLL